MAHVEVSLHKALVARNSAQTARAIGKRRIRRAGGAGRLDGGDLRRSSAVAPSKKRRERREGQKAEAMSHGKFLGCCKLPNKLLKVPSLRGAVKAAGPPSNFALLRFHLAAWRDFAIRRTNSWRAAGRSRAAIVLRRARFDCAPLSPAFGSRMINPFQFMQEVRSEGSKVSWPTRRETLITSGLVILMVLLASLFFVFVDFALRKTMELLLRVVQ
jgi:preprotein translocase subunit SecE